MDPIVIATGNPHKVEEMRAIFGSRGIPVIGLKDLGGSFTEPTETGGTFEENATIKALSYAEQTGRICLADDSGLEVDALGGAPGVISSHYSTDGRETGLSRQERDTANNQKLLVRLAKVPERERTARFVCVMCLAGPDLSLGGAGFQPAQSPPAHKPSDFQFFDGKFDKTSSGDLPHWQVGRATYFVTFNLLKGQLSDEERAIVCDACLFWHGTRLILHQAVVMPDHVHMIFRPLQQADGLWPTLKGIMHSIKRHTSNQIQKLRGTSGMLWQEENFDRIIRSHSDFEEKMHYVAMNPVKAGLCSKPGLYPYRVDGSMGGLQTRPPQAGEQEKPRVLALCRGTFEGRIGMPGDVPRGDHGFGYDPLFLLPFPDTRSSAELSPEEKNRLSHRGAAAAKMAQEIRSLL